MKPKTATYDIGKDAYGRSVTLTFSKNYDEKEMWTIRTDPINQRDESQTITGLSMQNLCYISEVVTSGI